MGRRESPAAANTSVWQDSERPNLFNLAVLVFRLKTRGAASRLMAGNIENSAMISREAAFQDSLAQRARINVPQNQR